MRGYKKVLRKNRNGRRRRLAAIPDGATPDRQRHENNNFLACGEGFP